MAARILIVEDDQGIQQLVEVNLTRAGHLVQCAENAEAAQVMVRGELPDIVLLDWKLPGMSGIEMARWMKSDPRTRDVGMIMLTARADERDVVAGFQAGADDYIIKPFSVRELLARVAAVLRRRVPQASTDVVEAGGLRLDPALHRVTAAGATLELGRMELRLLHFLMVHSDRVHSRLHLLDQVWGDHTFFEERTVDAHIRRLRAALQARGLDGLIQTVRGSGFRFSTDR